MYLAICNSQFDDLTGVATGPVAENSQCLQQILQEQKIISE